MSDLNMLVLVVIAMFEEDKPRRRALKMAANHILKRCDAHEGGRAAVLEPEWEKKIVSFAGMSTD